MDIFTESLKVHLLQMQLQSDSDLYYPRYLCVLNFGPKNRE